MEQHPIPQPISAYEFQLIGSMTLKQFAKLAACSLIALIFYALPLPDFLKWPLVIGFAALGLGLAFLPLNERPLDTWIVSFFKAVFSPTQYIWRKEPLVKNMTSFSGNTLSTFKSPPLFPSTVTATIPKTSKDEEDQLMENMTSLFSSSSLKSKTAAKLPLSSVKTEEKSVEAKSATKEAFPFAPKTPNVISGLVKDKEGQFIAGAILEIKDLHGHSVRAMRSNKLGQFRTATPLSDGTYKITTEKEGFSFDIIEISLTGEVVLPVEINAK